jgi:hypothetical protein
LSWPFSHNESPGSEATSITAARRRIGQVQPLHAMPDA